MTNREKFTEIFGCEIVQRDTGEAIPGHCKILITSDKHFNEWLKQEYVQPTAQPDVPDTNVGDMISRQAAIDTFLTELTKRERKNFLHTWSTVEVKYFVADMLEKLPSAQPTDRNGQERTGTDLISRQAALNCVYGTSPNKIKGRIAELPSATDTNVGGNLIDRQAALDALRTCYDTNLIVLDNGDELIHYGDAVGAIEALPSAQPNLSEAYSKAVFTWLMDYQIRAAELKGRYTPYEVLSWVINDWRKEDE